MVDLELDLYLDLKIYLLIFKFDLYLFEILICIYSFELSHHLFFLIRKKIIHLKILKMTLHHTKFETCKYLLNKQNIII